MRRQKSYTRHSWSVKQTLPHACAKQHTFRWMFKVLTTETCASKCRIWDCSVSLTRLLVLQATHNEIFRFYLLCTAHFTPCQTPTRACYSRCIDVHLRPVASLRASFDRWEVTRSIQSVVDVSHARQAPTMHALVWVLCAFTMTEISNWVRFLYLSGTYQ